MKIIEELALEIGGAAQTVEAGPVLDYLSALQSGLMGHGGSAHPGLGHGEMWRDMLHHSEYGLPWTYEKVKRLDGSVSAPLDAHFYFYLGIADLRRHEDNVEETAAFEAGIALRKYLRAEDAKRENAMRGVTFATETTPGLLPRPFTPAPVVFTSTDVAPGVWRVQLDATVAVDDASVIAAVNKLRLVADRNRHLGLSPEARVALVTAANLLGRATPPSDVQRLRELCEAVLEERRGDLVDYLVGTHSRRGIDAPEIETTAALVIDVCDEITDVRAVIPLVRDRALDASEDLLEGLGPLAVEVGDTVRHAHVDRTMNVLDGLLAELNREGA